MFTGLFFTFVGNKLMWKKCSACAHKCKLCYQIDGNMLEGCGVMPTVHSHLIHIWRKTKDQYDTSTIHYILVNMILPFWPRGDPCHVLYGAGHCLGPWTYTKLRPNTPVAHGSIWFLRIWMYLCRFMAPSTTNRSGFGYGCSSPPVDSKRYKGKKGGSKLYILLNFDEK